MAQGGAKKTDPVSEKWEAKRFIMFIAQKTQVDGRDIVDIMSMVNVFLDVYGQYCLICMTYTCGTGREFDDYPSANLAAVHIQEVFRPVQ